MTIPDKMLQSDISLSVSGCLLLLPSTRQCFALVRDERLLYRHAPAVTPRQSSTVEKNTELAALLEENRRLIALLEQHRIDWRVPKPQPPASQAVEPPSQRSPEEKLAIFKRLFRGRSDVYPVRWENKQGKAGYSPACANEWKPGVCEKPRIKCADCGNRQWMPISRQTLIAHLTGLKTMGIYPLLPNDTCHFLAVDFDEADWRDDARAFVQSYEMLEVPVALEISRSGNGAHAWIFFDRAVTAR
jgi:hypothetical protein